MEQKFVKDEKVLIADLLAGSIITRFVQVEIGS
jgi:translation elongation factor EF-Ts